MTSHAPHDIDGHQFDVKEFVNKRSGKSANWGTHDDIFIFCILAQGRGTCFYA